MNIKQAKQLKSGQKIKAGGDILTFKSLEVHTIFFEEVCRNNTHKFSHFSFCELAEKSIRDMRAGDILVAEDGGAPGIVKAVLGEIFAHINQRGEIVSWYTFDYAEKHNWKIKPPTKTCEACGRGGEEEV